MPRTIPRDGRAHVTKRGQTWRPGHEGTWPHGREAWLKYLDEQMPPLPRRGVDPRDAATDDGAALARETGPRRPRGPDDAGAAGASDESRPPRAEQETGLRSGQETIRAPFSKHVIALGGGIVRPWTTSSAARSQTPAPVSAAAVAVVSGVAEDHGDAGDDQGEDAGAGKRARSVPA